MIDRVTMDVRSTFYELLFNRAKVKVREQALDVFRGELKAQEERLRAGTVGQLNVRRAEVALANEEAELINAQTQVRLSFLHLGELLGANWRRSVFIRSQRTVAIRTATSRSERMSGARGVESAGNKIAASSTSRLKNTNWNSIAANCGRTSTLSPATKFTTNVIPPSVANSITVMSSA